MQRHPRRLGLHRMARTAAFSCLIAVITIEAGFAQPLFGEEPLVGPGAGEAPNANPWPESAFERAPVQRGRSAYETQPPEYPSVSQPQGSQPSDSPPRPTTLGPPGNRPARPSADGQTSSASARHWVAENVGPLANYRRHEAARRDRLRLQVEVNDWVLLDNGIVVSRRQPIGQRGEQVAPGIWTSKPIYAEDAAPDPNAAQGQLSLREQKRLVRELLAEAVDQFCAAQYDRAAIALDRLAELEPRHASAALLRVQWGLATDEPDLAMDALTVATDRLPPHQWALVVQRFRQFYPQPELFTLQLRRLEQIVATNPQDTAAPLLLAFQYAGLGYWRDAIALCESVLQEEPGHALAIKMLDVYARHLRAQPDVNAPPRAGQAF